MKPNCCQLRSPIIVYFKFWKEYHVSCSVLSKLIYLRILQIARLKCVNIISILCQDIKQNIKLRNRSSWKLETWYISWKERSLKNKIPVKHIHISSVSWFHCFSEILINLVKGLAVESSSLPLVPYFLYLWLNCSH